MSWGAVGQWRTLSGNRVAPVITLTPDTVFIGIDEAIPLPAVVAVDDLDGDVSYKINGPTGTIDNTVGGVGTYQYSVADTEGNTATADYTVYIGPQAPVAVAGDNLSVIGGAGFSLDFSASSDVDGEIVDYAVTQLTGESVTLDFADPVRPVGIAPIALTAQTLTFLLTVTDDSGLTATSEVSVDVAAVAGPSANAGADSSAQPGELVTLDFSASLAGDSKIIDYTVEQTAGESVSLDNSDPVKPSFMAPYTSNSTPLNFLLTVTDENGFSSTDAVSVDVAVYLATDKINALADNTYTLKTPPVAAAYAGRNNLVNLAFAVETPSVDTALTDKGYFDFSDPTNSVAAIDVVVGDAVLRYPGEHVLIDGGLLKVRFGEMTLSEGNHYPQVIMYVHGDEKGIIICGKGLPATLQLNYIV